MKLDELIHTDEVRPHSPSATCWCNPIRRRYDPLTGNWADWDRDLQEWVPMAGPQIPPKDGDTGGMVTVMPDEQPVLVQPEPKRDEMDGVL